VVFWLDVISRGEEDNGCQHDAHHEDQGPDWERSTNRRQPNWQTKQQVRHKFQK